VTQLFTLSEEQYFLIDSIVDLLLTQKLTNLKVLQLQSDHFHDKVIICSSNSVTQMNAVIKKNKKRFKNK
jgi:ribosomal silencing factor RsfS